MEDVQEQNVMPSYMYIIYVYYFISIGATSAGRLELYFALFSDGQSTMSFTGKLSTGKVYFI